MRRLLAGLLLVATGLMASPSAVPVYDGIGAPDEPYRYAGSPAAPAPVRVTVAAPGGRSAALRLAGPEKGPQVLVDVAAGAFRTTATTVTLTATALPGDGQRVPQGTIDGNVYRLVADTGARLDPDAAKGILFLRAAVMTSPSPVLVHRLRPQDPWRSVRTGLAGRDVLSTPLRALGDYAVVRLPGSAPLAEGSGLSPWRVGLVSGGLLLLVLVTVLVLRRRPDPSDERSVTNP